jgi:hypothetical protein
MAWISYFWSASRTIRAYIKARVDLREPMWIAVLALGAAGKALEPTSVMEGAVVLLLFETS